jgi:DNA-binding IclR family transcriptional regulator
MSSDRGADEPNGEPRGLLDTELVGLLGDPLTIDVLAVLSERPRSELPPSFAELCTRLRVNPHRLDEAARTLAARGLISRDGPGGSWDRRSPNTTRYLLTAAGGRLAQRLSRFDVLVAIYEELFHRSRPPRRSSPPAG